MIYGVRWRKNVEIDFLEIESLNIDFLLGLLADPDYQLYVIGAGITVLLLFMYLVNRLRSVIGPMIFGMWLIFFFWQEWLGGDVDFMLNPPALFFGALLLIGIVLGLRYWERLRRSH
jgi:hypothetical protein